LIKLSTLGSHFLGFSDTKIQLGVAESGREGNDGKA